MEIVISKPKKVDNQLMPESMALKQCNLDRKGASYYTKHKDPQRNNNYINRQTRMRTIN